MHAPGRKTAWHLWAVGTFAALFNAIGVFDFVMYALQGTAYPQGAGMTPTQIAHYQAMPAWMTAAWAIGVFSAFGASILLLARRALALPVFALSLAAFLCTLAYHYVLTEGSAALGRGMAITNAAIAGLLLLFIVYARAMARRGVLR